MMELPADFLKFRWLHNRPISADMRINRIYAKGRNSAEFRLTYKNYSQICLTAGLWHLMWGVNDSKQWQYHSNISFFKKRAKCKLRYSG